MLPLGHEFKGDNSHFSYLSFQYELSALELFINWFEFKCVDIGADVFETSSKRGTNVGKNI